MGIFSILLGCLAMKMPVPDKERMTAMYRARLAEHGPSPQALGWTKGKQDLRFEVLLSPFVTEGCRVLDVGCGLGDLIRKLSGNGHFTYLGVDLVKEFIELARKQHEEEDTEFRAGEFLEMEFDEPFDIVVGSGIFNFALDGMDHEAYVKRMLARMLELSRKGVAVDFLSNRVNFEEDHCAHTSPERALAAGLELTRSVRLRHDYMPFEFAMWLFKDDAYDEADTIFKTQME